MQDRIIPAGKYIIRYFINGGYTVRYQTTIEVRQTKKIDLDLTQVEFTSGAFTYDGKAHSLAVSGTLPEGVTVTYENNAQTKEGAYQVKATFYLNGSVIESRYAVLTIEPGTIDRLVVNKTVFEQGEDILITATAPADSDNESWWVGLYLVTDVVENGTDQSIYWYSVKDGSHLNGTAYNIREQTHNSKRGDYYYIPVGKYKVVLFNSSGYTVEKTVEIEVVAPTSTVKGTLATDKTTYTENETVMVTATCREKAGRKTYWVGLYLATEDPATVTSIYWYYVKDDTHASGTACDIKKQDINASRGDYAALPAGKYKLVLFNTLGEAEATVEFTVVGA